MMLHITLPFSLLSAIMYCVTSQRHYNYAHALITSNSKRYDCKNIYRFSKLRECFFLKNFILILGTAKSIA